MPARPGHLDGAHYSAQVRLLNHLRRTGQLAAYEHLLWRCVEATEAESRADGCGVAPAYYERLAILFRKQGRRENELSVLQRYQQQRKAPGVGPTKLAERLAKLRALALALLILLPTLAAGQSTYRVERIVDGDTVVLSELGTARLIGVDTPETVDPRRPVEAFGHASSAFLTGLIGGKTVRIEYDQTRKDRYGRVLVYLYLPDGTFVNLEIVRQGYGHAYTEFPFTFMEDFRAAEQEARSASRGLWAGTPAAAAPTTAARSGASAVTVYVTRTGEKYHRAGCRSLARSQIAMPLAEAAQRYGPCSICRPPTPGP